MTTISAHKRVRATNRDHVDLELGSIVPRLFATQGFLGTGATFGADLNLIAQLVMGLALVGGAVLARRKRYKAHGICQTTVLFFNLVAIGLVMWPSFHQQVQPAIPKALHKWYYAAAAVHALFGVTAELFGLYIVLVAGTALLPLRLRFQNWRRWMRAELMLWYFVLLTGVTTYYAWYVAPFR
jgi:uncharacterized membrane protein YozB (DUF420 family)